MWDWNIILIIHKTHIWLKVTSPTNSIIIFLQAIFKMLILFKLTWSPWFWFHVHHTNCPNTYIKTNKYLKHIFWNKWHMFQITFHYSIKTMCKHFCNQKNEWEIMIYKPKVWLVIITHGKHFLFNVVIEPTFIVQLEPKWCTNEIMWNIHMTHQGMNLGGFITFLS